MTDSELGSSELTASELTASGRGSPERGSGVLSTTFGILVFVSLLAFSIHVLVNMWMRATVMDVAAQAATSVALSGATSATELARAEGDAIATARSSLGSLAERVELDFVDEGDPAAVRLHVRAANLSLMPRMGSLDPAPDPIDRVIVVHRELIRERPTT